MPAIRANIIYFALALFFTMLCGYLFSQNDSELIVRADKHFQNENYPESMRLYSQLLSLHRKDPFYSYRFGVSLLYSDRRDPNAAIRYIEAGLGKLEGEDAVMIYFHLGTAYHLTFRFIEALRYYNIFKETAVHRKYAVYNVNLRVFMCNNGIKLLQNIRDLYVFERHHVPLENFFRSYNISRFGGRLLVKPEQFKSRFDKKREESTIIFLSDAQNVVYYSSYGRDGKGGKDIYRSIKMSDGNWSSPERLGNAINTEQDEDFPFILPDGKTLYFSSKGHNSMGGYDIFRSTWDENKKDWTTPVNLDFAINTPYDDILFVTDNEERYAYFSSVRNSGVNKINVYMVRIDIRPERMTEEILAQVVNMSADVKDENYVKAVQKIQQISNLEVNSSIEEFDRKDNDRRKQLFADNYKYNISDNPTVDELINLTFQHANDAERSFQMLRQKRQATEMSAERFKERSLQYSEESEKLNALSLEEKNIQNKKTLDEQATEMRNKADETQRQYVNAINLMNELTKSVAFQKNEYDKILFRAGEIQRLASGWQIDTSVVLLKQLIDDINTYEISIDEYIAKVFPSPQRIEKYQEEVKTAQKNIIEINDSIKKLLNEKDLFKTKLLLEKNPDSRNVLITEVVAIDNEIEHLHLRKKQIYDNIQKNIENIRYAENKLLETQSELFIEIALSEKIIESEPDSNIENINNIKSDQPLSAKEIKYTPEQQAASAEQATTDTEQYEEASIAAKTKKIEELLLLEKAILNLSKHETNLLIYELITEIESTEKEITSLNQILSDPTLSMAERRLAEIKADRLIAAYTEDIRELDKFLLLHKQTEIEVVEFEKHTVIANVHIEAINKYIKEDNERRVTTEFTKLSDLVKSYIKPERASIRIVVQNYSSDLNTVAEQFKSKAEKAEKKAIDFMAKSEKAFEKAEKVRNETKKQELIDESLKYDVLFKSMKDSVKFYRNYEADKRQHAIQIAKSETELTTLRNSIQTKFTDAREIELSTSTSSIKIPAQTMQRMKSIIADNPYSDSFPTIIKKANLWNNIIEFAQTKPEFILATQLPNRKTEQILAVEKGNYSTAQLNEIREREQVYILRSAATLHLTRIKQLEEKISTSNNAQTVASSFIESNRLKRNLQGIITEHNQIASKYSDLGNLTSIEFHTYDELSVDPELSIAVIDKQIQVLEAKLIELQTRAQTITSHIDKERIQKETDKITSEIQKAHADRLRILDMSEINKMLARLIVISDLPLDGIDHKTINTLNELKNQFRFNEQNAYATLEQADKMKNLNQKKVLLIESYEQILQAAELQQSILDIYLKHLPSDINFSVIAMQSITQALENQQKSNEILAELNIQTTNVSQREIINDSTASMENITNIAEVGTTFNITDTVTATTPYSSETVLQPITTDISTIISDIGSADFQSFYSEANPIPLHTAPSGKLLFRVQFLASRRPTPENAFAGMTPIFYEQSEGWYRYMHGEFFNPDNALTARNKVRTLGYSDAFVVAYYNGERISNAEARAIYSGSSQLAIATHTESVVIVDNMETSRVGAGSNIDFNQLEGLYFAVQIGVYGSPRTSERLFGISPLIEERLPNGNFRYMTGTFGTLTEANAARNVIRAGGVPDAYVVAFRNGVRISVREAQTLIEAGEKTTMLRFETVSLSTQNVALAENTFFRVQLGAYLNQVPVEVVNAFISISGDGIDILQGKDGMTIYVTGKFKTKNDAEQLKIKVQNGGINDAFIIAVQGDKKISIQEAQEILGIR